jgi:hypothetical protein
MNIMQWNGDKQVLYWKKQMSELDARENIEEENRKFYKQGEDFGIETDKKSE